MIIFIPSLSLSTADRQAFAPNSRAGRRVSAFVPRGGWLSCPVRAVRGVAAGSRARNHVLIPFARPPSSDSSYSPNSTRADPASQALPPPKRSPDETSNHPRCAAASIGQWPLNSPVRCRCSGDTILGIPAIPAAIRAHDKPRSPAQSRCRYNRLTRWPTPRGFSWDLRHATTRQNATHTWP